MASKTRNQYFPTVVPAPGELLRDILEERQMSQSELAERTGLTLKTINAIVKGKAPITPQTARKLELVLGTPAEVWSRAEQAWQEWKVRQQENEELKTHVDVLREVPYATMRKHGWVRDVSSKVDKLRETLGFFAVGSVQQLQDLCLRPEATYRRTTAFENRAPHIAVWLRQGEIQARDIRTISYSREKFLAALHEIRAHTPHTGSGTADFVTGTCAPAGVAVTFVKEIPKAPISGACRWLAPDRVLIQLSLRGKTDDQLWFSFFHEAGHVLKHPKKLGFVDIDRSTPANAAMEDEADRFARDFLIPPAEYASFLDDHPRPTRSAVLDFAERLGIAPGIVVGRLQHEQVVGYDQLNRLKKKLTWV